MTATNIIYATKDTFVTNVSEETSNANFGKDSSLFSGSNYSSLLYFDLSTLPANAIITSAKLYLYVFRMDQINNIDTVPVTINLITDNFYESIVTAKNMPTTAPLPLGDTGKLEIKLTDVGNIVCFNNLTKTISYWYANESRNHGFSLDYSTIPSFIGFSSRECNKKYHSPHLKVDYTISNDIPDIEVTEIIEKICPLPLGTKTNIYDTSNDIFFSYIIDNTKNLSLYATLLACSTKTGKFKNIGKEIKIPEKTITTIEVSSSNKYSCLLLRGTNFEPDDKINLTAHYKTFSNMVPSRVASIELLEDGITVLLTMTKPLIGITADKDSFTINNITSQNPVIITSSTVSKETVKLTLSAPISSYVDLLLTYKATENSDLTGLNGDVDNFSDKLIINNSLIDPPRIHSGIVTLRGKTLSLMMTKPLTSTSLGLSSFGITTASKTPISITDVKVFPSTVQMQLSKSINTGEELYLSYKSTETNALTGSDLKVDDFVKKILENKSIIGPPVVTSSTIQIDGKSILLKFSNELWSDTHLFDKNLFKLSGVDSNISSIKSDNFNYELTLSLDKPIESDKVVSLTYKAPETEFSDGPETNLLEGPDGKVSTFICKPIINLSRINLPAFISAGIISATGTEIKLTLTNPLNTKVLPAPSSFTILGAKITIKSLKFSDPKIIVLYLSEPINGKDIITLNYTAPRINFLIDTDNLVVPNFTNKPIVNASKIGDAIFVTGTLTDNIILVINKDLDLSVIQTIPPEVFTLYGTDTVITVVSLDKKIITLTLSKPINSDAVIAISYTGSKTTPIKTKDNFVLADFSHKLLLNKSENTPGLPGLCSISKGGTEITLAMTSILIGETADKNAFIINTTPEKLITVNSVSISTQTSTEPHHSILTLSLSSPITEPSTLSYISTGTNNLTHISGYLYDFTNHEIQIPSALRRGVLNSNGNLISLMMTKPLAVGDNYINKLPDISSFKLSTNSTTPVLVNSLQVSSGTVNLLLDTEINGGTELQLSYTSNAPDYLKGPDGIVESFSDKIIENYSIIGPPILHRSNISKDGLKIHVYMSKPLEMGIETLDTSVFSISISGKIVNIIKSLDYGLSDDPFYPSDLDILLTTPIEPNKDVSLTYTPTTENYLEGKYGTGKVSAFTEKITDNNSIIGSPFIIESYLDTKGTTICLTTSKPLVTSSLPRPMTFTLLGTSSTIQSISFNADGNILLALSPDIKRDAILTLNYTKPKINPLVGIDNTGEVASFSNKQIDNFSNKGAAVITIATINAIDLTTRKLITLRMNKDLKEDYISASSFSLYGTSTVVNSVQISKNEVVLTLDKNITEDESYQILEVSYTAPTTNYLKTEDGSAPVASFIKRIYRNA